MMFGTYYMPFCPDGSGSPTSVTWNLLSVQAISVPLTSDPFLSGGPIPAGIPNCQRNIYNYYLYNCVTGLLSPLLIDGSITQTCQPGPTGPFFQAVTCEGIYALLEPNGGFDEAAYLSVSWNFKAHDCNIQYSCSIEWFNDVRSNVVIFDPNVGADRKYKVMLLGANHTF
jgi:hypothetical protein